MATAPQPPRPPVPPRAGSPVVAIALLILALIVLTSVIAVWTGLRFLSRGVQVHVDERGGDKKEVSIKTPVGSLEVRKDVNEAQLGLPLYPGAKRLKGEDSATVSLGLPDEQSVRVVAAKFETTDAFDKVRDFYKTRLGTEVTRITERSPEGKTIFEIKKGDTEKVVALKNWDSGTRIELVHVTHGRPETN